jgi:glycosyltransferase involved in cell wall biosynthesis
LKRVNVFCNSLRLGGAERQASYLMDSFDVSNLFLIEDDVHLKFRARNKIALSKFALGDPSWKKTLSLPRFILDLSPYRNDLKQSIVISFNTRPNLLNICSKFLWNNKAILSERMNPTQSWKGGLKFFQRFLSAITYRFADLIVVNSYGIKQDLAKFLKISESKIRVIYNSVDLKSIAMQAKEPLSAEDSSLFQDLTICIVGRQRMAKGQWHLIRAFSKVIEKVPEVKMVIIGGTGEVENIQRKLVEDFRLSNSVFFLGEKDNPMKYMSNSGCFVFPSIHEGFPNVLLEALGCGCPVISSDCRFGPREILNLETDYSLEKNYPFRADYGFLMPSFDNRIRSVDIPVTDLESLWADKIVELLLDKEQITELKAKARERVKDFSKEKIMEDWQKAIKEFF